MTSAAFLYAPPPTCYSWKIAAVLCPHNTLVSSPQHIPGVEAKGVSGLILSGVYTSSASSPWSSSRFGDQTQNSVGPPHSRQKKSLPHPTLNPRINQRPGTRDGLSSGHPQFHAEHFGHFVPTVRSIVLREPKGSRQVFLLHRVISTPRSLSSFTLGSILRMNWQMI